MPCFRQLNTTVYPRPGYFAINGFSDTAMVQPPLSSVVGPWLARRVGFTCMEELDVDTLFKHLSRTKGYIFPAPTAPGFNAAPPESEWIPRLVTSA